MSEEILKRLEIIEILASENEERLDCLWAERRELTKVLKERAESDAICAAKEAAETENETLIEKDLQ